MKTESCMIVTMVLVAGCADGRHQGNTAVNTVKSARVEIYARGDGRDSVGCRRLPNEDICISSEALGSQFFDCSTRDFDCVFDAYTVYAVPKAGLKAGETYNVFGATLTVKRCFGDADGCDIAMVSSNCAGDAVCSCRLTSVGKTTGIFYYSRELGITSFYSTGSPHEIGKRLTTDEWKLLEDGIPLRTYVLKSTGGFLKEHWNIRAAKFETNCTT